MRNAQTLEAIIDQQPFLALLRREFEADEGSFLLRLRGDMEWDRAAFSRLVEAMESCCRRGEGSERLERWQVAGFWYLSWFVRSWTSNPNFPRPYPAEYYESAYERLEDLACWFFFGQNPCEEPVGVSG